MPFSKMPTALLLLVLLGITWGSGYTLAKYAMTHEVAALGYSFWQSLGPALLLTIAALIHRETALYNRYHFSYFFCCGLLGIAIPNTNMYFIASQLPAGLLAVIVNTVPLMVYPLALLLKQESFDAGRLLAIVLGITGIILLINPSSASFSFSIIQALLSPLAFALTSLYITFNQPKSLPTISAAAGMLWMASLMLLPLVIKDHAFFSLMPPFTPQKKVVMLEILLSSVGYLLFFKLIRLAGPVFYSLTGTVVALTGLLWGYIIFHEHLTLTDGVACGFVLAALFLLSWRQTKLQQVISEND